MAEVTSISGDAWCLTSDVRDRIRLKVGQDNPDFETEIEEATDSMQSMWSEFSGAAVGSSDMPATESDLPNLLQQATAYMAASEAHLKFSQNVRGQNEDGQRHVFLEDKAQDKFDQWKSQADLDPEDEDDPDVSGTDVTARTGSLDPFGGD